MNYNKYAEESYDFSIINNPEIKSVFIIAAPSPVYIFRVGGELDLKIPPIYGNRDEIVQNIKRITQEVFTGCGYHTYPVLLPKKLFAAHCGLAEYGNNGITYIKEYGSYFRYTMFASDYPWINTSPWGPIKIMKSCERCGKCVQVCPGKAITKGSPWINTHLCITAINEQEGEFPLWIKASDHNCLVGCFKCQEVCPQNHKKGQEVILSLTRDFLNQLQSVSTYKNLNQETKDILEKYCIQRYFKVLKRNLEVLMKQRCGGDA